MPKKIPEPAKVRKLEALEVDDQGGEDWHRESRLRWSAAEEADPETPILAYDAPAFPDWSTQAPAHVTREVFGRFLQDRDTRTVHDVYRATPECAVDAVRNGTFFHFWSEVVAETSVADDLPCPHCIAC